jgi:hypothetical protein
MGEGGRYREERKPREREERESNRDRPQRNFENFSRDKDGGGDDAEARPRNGLSRGKSEPWFKSEGESQPLTSRERMDRQKSWRDRDKDAGEALEDRSGGSRTYERRWDRDRDHRAEREPEWLDEPQDRKVGGHTEEDFKKFMESMKASKMSGNGPDSKAAAASEPPGATIDAEKPKAESVPAVEPGPDKFFLAFGGNTSLEAPAGTSPDVKEAPSKGKSGAKSSRFTSFFNAPQEDARRQTEPPTPFAAVPPNGAGGHPPAQDGEKEAFQQLLLKLQRQTMQTTSTPPAAMAFQDPPPPPHQQVAPDMMSKSAVASPEPFQQYGGDRREGPHTRPPHVMQDVLAPRPMMPSQPPQVRQDQLLQDLVGQRQRAPSQGTGRMESNPTRNSSNTEFLMNLMRAAPEPPRQDPGMMRMPQPQKQAQIPQLIEREPDLPRDARPPQRQMRGQQGPPGFMEEPFHHGEPDNRPQQPTQILQRPPPPPGLDQMNWMPGAGQLPPSQRPMMGPPGLPGGPNRPFPGMFPHNFPPGPFPPEGMAGPPRNMQPPPGFFGGPPPPPGFIPPPGMGGFQGPPGPDSHGFGVPFDSRGMPPPGPGAAGPFRRA